MLIFYAPLFSLHFQEKREPILLNLQEPFQFNTLTYLTNYWLLGCVKAEEKSMTRPYIDLVIHYSCYN